MDAFAAARLVIGAAFLVVATASDLRTRRVRDVVWIALGGLGLGILAFELAVTGVTAGAWLLVLSAAILFFAVLFGKPLLNEDGFHFRPMRVALFLVAGLCFVGALFLPLSVSASNFGGPTTAYTRVVELASMPVMIVLYQGFYQVRLVHGGADAKGLMALTLLFPTYPDAAPFPILTPIAAVEGALRVLFPHSLVVWVDAAIVALAVPVGLFLYNASRGDFGLPAFVGYRARIDKPPRHVWPMEKILDGEHVIVFFPSRGGNPAEEFARLRAQGIKRAWVQPKIPFMAPLLVGFLLAFFVGNLLWGLFLR